MGAWDTSHKNVINLRPLSKFSAALRKDCFQSLDIKVNPTAGAKLRGRLVHQNVLATTQRWNKEIHEEGSIPLMICVNEIKHRLPQKYKDMAEYKKKMS